MQIWLLFSLFSKLLIGIDVHRYETESTNVVKSSLLAWVTILVRSFQTKKTDDVVINWNLKPFVISANTWLHLRQNIFWLSFYSFFFLCKELNSLNILVVTDFKLRKVNPALLALFEFNVACFEFFSITSIDRKWWRSYSVFENQLEH